MKLKFIKKLLLGLSFLTLGVLLGANFMHTKHWPYHFFRQLGLGGVVSNFYAEGEGGLFEEVFANELPARDRLAPDIESRTELIAVVNAMAAPRTDIRGVGEALHLIGPMLMQELTQDMLVLSKVNYVLDARKMEAYSYKIGSTTKSINPEQQCATLIIPGSGHDQGLAIALHDKRNYHSGIVEAFTGCDIFILIKPNEDYLSISRNGSKLSDNAYINHLIGIGSSYSSRYITDAIAIAMMLKRHYPQLIVTGLSQGGTAAVLVGIEVEPKFTIAASGLYEIQGDLGYGGFNSSVLFPGLQRQIFKEWLPMKLREAKSDFLILSGIHEAGLAGQDAREGWTCGKIVNMSNVTCLTHPGGHTYPSKEVKRYITQEWHMSNKMHQLP